MWMHLSSSAITILQTKTTKKQNNNNNKRTTTTKEQQQQKNNNNKKNKRAIFVSLLSVRNQFIRQIESFPQQINKGKIFVFLFLFLPPPQEEKIVAFFSSLFFLPSLSLSPSLPLQCPPKAKFFLKYQQHFLVILLIF